MKKLSQLILVLACLASLIASPVYSQRIGWHVQADELLRVYVKPGGQVDYAGLKKEQGKLAGIIKEIGKYAPSKEEEKAFYINAYNLIVLNEVVINYPIKSVMDQPGFFDKKKHTVAGKSVTLNELEKEYLMKIDQDARLHFVLVCAAKSCPPLAPFYFIPGKLDGVLNARTRLALADPQFIRVDKKNKTVMVSKIFEWYAADFGGRENIVAYINEFRVDKIPSNYRLGFYEYDWSLNGVGD